MAAGGLAPSGRVRTCALLLLSFVSLPLFGAIARVDRARESELEQQTAVRAPAADGAAKPIAVNNGGRVTVFVQLTEESAARAYAHVLNAGGGVTAASHSTNFIAAANSAARAQRAVAVRQQTRFMAQLQASGVKFTEIYRVQRVLNGVAMKVDGSAIARIRNLPDVARILPMQLQYPTSAPPTSNAVPFMQVPTVWQLPVGANHADGTGVRIGIIDTGIDYIHADFGGSGLLTDYQANNTTVAPDAYFPTVKVVGGTDLAGDAYDGNITPVPDPDPMDCDGHGTHVAGIAAGFGVTTTGGTFTGPYDGTVPFSTLRIHPGVAPKALLYAIRVFGCGGGTNLAIQGIDWALDPNNDNNLSDHLDVVNLSLGSLFGSTEDPELQAVDAAAAVGMSLAISAGNSGNVYFIGGAPGAADRATTVAASIDNGYPGAGFRVNTPAGIAGFHNSSVAAGFGGVVPDVGLTGNVVLVQNGVSTDGCTPLTNALQILGNIAIFDRNLPACGNSNSTPALNAQNAGAIAAIQIYNTSPVPLPDVAGTNAAVTIPYIRVSQADGLTLKANLAAGVNVTLYNGGDQLASFSSRGPRGSSVVRLKPDIAAPGVNIFSAETGNSCTTASNAGCIFPSLTGFNPGSLAASLSGTSMAAPQVTGLTALMRQIHPDWSTEEIKALLMNTASHAVTQFPAGNGQPWTPPRIGSGRPDPPTAAQSSSLAFNAEGNGSVSVSFGDDFATSATRTGKVRVENKGASAVTYDLAIVPAIDAPGLSYSLPGGSLLTVLAGASQTIDVRLNANPTLMQHTRDATMPPTEVDMASLGTLNKQFVTEESAYLTFSIGGVEKMRVPLYAVSRPASQMAGSSPANGTGATGSGVISLSGSGVCTGTLSGSNCTGSFPTDEVSLVSPFEMQVVSPRDPVNSTPSADIQYAGVAYDSAHSMLMFGVSTYGDWSTPSETAVNIYIDNNNDGVWDYIIFNGGAGYIGQVFGQSTANGDAQINVTYAIATTQGSWGTGIRPSTYTNGDPGQSDNALLRNNTVVLKALRADVGVTGPFHYKVVTCPGWALVDCDHYYGFHYDEAAGPYPFDFANQGLNFGGASLVQDLPGATIPVTWNTAALAANGTLGALLLHHHNVAGQRAQFIPLNGATTADIGVRASVSPANATQGQNITLTVTATNNGPAAASGVLVWVPVPIGTNWVTDNGGGTYDPTTEIWTVGALANGASSTHQVVFNRISSSPVLIQAKLSASSPLDANATNNNVRFVYPSAADLSLTASAANPTVLTGNAATFTYTITNNGSDPAYNVLVATSLTGFAGLTYSSPIASAGVFNPATGRWSIAGLDVGNSATLQFNVTAPNAIVTLTTTGTASSDISDPVAANNMASASVQVLSPATLSATMAHGGSTSPNFTTTYTVVIHNTGSRDQQDNAGDEFTLVAPSQVSVTAATASSGTASFVANTVHWNGAVPAGGTVTITISATIGSVPFGTVISAQGSVFFDADGNGTNESTALTDDPATATAGDATSFTVTPLIPLGSSTASMTYSTLSQPCRVIDTRLGGGALAGGASRNFHVVGATGFTAQGGNSSGCAVPAGAAAAVINFVAVSPTGAGNLRGSAFPNAVPAIGSVINYAQETPVLNIANGIIFPLCDASVNNCSAADITLLANGSATDVVADVLGYFMRFPIEQIRTFAVTNATGGGTTIGTSCTNLATITVNAPASGSVIVHANVAISVLHVNGTTDSVLASINTSPTDCQDASVLGESAQSSIDGSEPTATYKPLLEIQRSFPVPVGSVTYYINALKTTGSSSQTLENAGVVATFHPN